ncbi:hypothetical protein DPMN_158209 [Dreissena polymorpha]|uniref:Uncharacterized protein n=1 Tax=Dreissena polymorpha TaxID=45954 RepID=A0A9D4IMZ2_DREPO|nr:hypothetical protein DPMN_158209 [Dreissena polymorpha]
MYASLVSSFPPGFGFGVVEFCFPYLHLQGAVVLVDLDFNRRYSSTASASAYRLHLEHWCLISERFTRQELFHRNSIFVKGMHAGFPKSGNYVPGTEGRQVRLTCNACYFVFCDDLALIRLHVRSTFAVIEVLEQPNTLTSRGCRTCNVCAGKQNRWMCRSLAHFTISWEVCVLVLCPSSNRSTGLLPSPLLTYFKK